MKVQEAMLGSYRAGRYVSVVVLLLAFLQVTFRSPPLLLQPGI